MVVCLISLIQTIFFFTNIQFLEYSSLYWLKFFVGVQMTASLRNFSGFFSVFYPILVVLQDAEAKLGIFKYNNKRFYYKTKSILFKIKQ